MEKDFKITIDSQTAQKDMKEAKAVVKALKTLPYGTSSALECMELETYKVYHVTNYIKKNGELQLLKRSCDLQRVTPLQIEVTVQYGKTILKVSWDAKGTIDDNSCFAEIHALASWEDGWYSWVYAEEDGTPEAPLATVYILEENI